MIEALQLQKQFGDFTAVKNISFSARKGEIFGIAGPNGAGKSTIVKMLSTILSPTGGTALVNGMDVRKEAQKIRQIVGYLPEEPRVYDYLSAKDFLKFFANVYGVKNSDRKISELLDFVGLKGHENRKIGDYSKGMKQRISIARTLIHDPPVLILDEPTMGLDPASARELREKIISLRDEGKTILICTHYMDEADFLCDKLAILDQGEVAALGKPEELKAKIARKRFISVVLEETEKIRERKFVGELGASEKGRNILVETKNTNETIKEIYSAAKVANVKILSLKNLDPTLDDVFIEVTRRR